jgi:hypothetical protein
MACLISFTTTRFDPADERPNPINDIAGEGVLLWLREHAIMPPYETSAPDAEDWGWYMDVIAPDGSYLVGACAQWEDESAPTEAIEWLVQIDKHRSLLDKLLGRNKLTTADPLVESLAAAIRREASFTAVSVEQGH